MSDERFFSNVKSSLYDFAPVVPEETYKGMRRRLWMSNFTRLSATRFNMWYLLLALAGGSAAVVYSYNSNAPAAQVVIEGEPAMSASPVVGVENNAVVSHSTNCSASGSSASCCSANKSASSSASCFSKKENPNNAISAKTDKETMVSEGSLGSAPAQAETPLTAVTEAAETLEETMEESPVLPDEVSKKSRKGRGLPITVYQDKDQKKDQ
jgi:hypothetical protein